MRIIIFQLLIFFLLTSCGSKSRQDNTLSENDKLKLVEKRILQKRVQKAGGLLKAEAFKIESIKRIGDSTFNATYNFMNPMVDMEIRMTDYYVFTKNLDSIILDSNLNVQSKVEGDWIDMGW